MKMYVAAHADDERFHLAYEMGNLRRRMREIHGDLDELSFTGYLRHIHVPRQVIADLLGVSLKTVELRINRFNKLTR